jgi:NAD(P)-dependent dehydrogenase (short-subunit alcohol dehydrogenase family)
VAQLAREQVTVTRELKGRVVLITGAAGGLGAALCQRYAAAGAKIAALDLDAAKLDTLTTSLRAKGTEALALPATSPTRLPARPQ